VINYIVNIVIILLQNFKARHLNAQGDSWFVDFIAGDDFLCLCYQKSSNKHVSDFGECCSYGRL